MSWRTAKSLDVLLHQVDAAYPGRDKSSDGTIGDAAHQATKSEHNPDANGIVRARDITNDPAHGLNARSLAEALIASRDPRILYVISNAQICSSVVQPWVWRPYNGVNAHRAHMHLSVVENPALYDDERPWDIAAAPPLPKEGHVLIELGDRGPAVSELQQLLGMTGDDVDGIFGRKTDTAVRAYQAAHGLTVDGEVGPNTWAALLAGNPAPSPGNSPVTLSPSTIAQIVSLARSSDLARYKWADRDRAPVGYICGMAVVFARTLLKLKAGDSAARAMTIGVGAYGVDALAWYGYKDSAFLDRPAMLRKLFALLYGLGMRESSGNCFEGRDMAASNMSPDTSEAGLFQQSHDSFGASVELPKLMDAYRGAKQEGYLSIFREGLSGNVPPSSGTTDGDAFQQFAKAYPAFAVEVAAVGLRVIRKHWGPINRREAEVRPEAEQLLLQVQNLIEGIKMAEPTPVPQPAPQPKPAPDIIPPKPGTNNLPALTGGLFGGSLQTLFERIEQFGPRAKRDILLVIMAYNFVWRDDQIVVASESAPIAAPAPQTASSVGPEHVGIVGLLSTWALQHGDMLGTMTGDKASVAGTLLNLAFGGLAAAGVVPKIVPVAKGVLSLISKFAK